MSSAGGRDNIIYDEYVYVCCRHKRRSLKYLYDNGAIYQRDRPVTDVALAAEVQLQLQLHHNYWRARVLQYN